MIYFYASERHYLDHLEPIARATHGKIMIPNGDTALEEECEQRLFSGFGYGSFSWGLWKTGPTDPLVVASYGDLLHARGHWRGPLVLAEHGAGQTYGGHSPAYADGGNREGVHMALVPGPWPAQGYARTSPHVKVVQVGLPKLDILRRQAAAWKHSSAYVLNPITVAFSFHWAGPHPAIIPELAAGWPYWMSTIQALKEDLPGVHLIGHGHPRSWSQLRPIWESIGIEPVEHFDEVCGRASLLVVDNSSIAFEFAAVTGHPILLLNHPSWTKPSPYGLRFGAVQNYFHRCESAENLAQAIDLALWERDDKTEAERRSHGLDLVYFPREGGAKVAAQAVLGLI